MLSSSSYIILISVARSYIIGEAHARSYLFLVFDSSRLFDSQKKF